MTETGDEVIKASKGWINEECDYKYVNEYYGKNLILEPFKKF